ncbi:peptidoglycan-binding protein [Oryzobacter telluris]|uniref:peptidoglycan-binding domain-containing protein n=1 Tax=Oryzobacter telluris TaxID=3149179 RepID=UPI00370D251C
MSLSHPAPRKERRIPVRTLGAVSATVLAFPLVIAPADGAVFPTPAPVKPLPSALDVAAPYQKGTQCLTENQPGAVAFAKLLNATYGTRTYGILRHCAAEHGEGRALDWMINASNPDQLALANALTRWLAAPDNQGRAGAMAKRFGINYIIWNRQQWRAYAPERGWVPYYGVSPHTDHIHFSFNWDGAYKRTSWWTGVAVTTPSTGPTGGPVAPVTPPAAPVLTSTGYPVLAQGATGADVTLAQKAIGAAADGKFGPLTAAALGTWQSKNGIPATKKLDEATWAKLVALDLVPNRANVAALTKYVNVVLKRGATGDAVKALQKAIGKLTVDGSYGPGTEARVKEYQKAEGITVTGVTDKNVWNALMGLRVTPTPAPAPAPTPTPAPAPAPPAQGSTSTHPLAKYAGVTLKLWSRGEAVKAMQKAIGKLTVDGSFGRATEARVKEYQKAKGLTVDGVVDAKVWKALMAPVKPASPTPSTGTTSSALDTEFTKYKATTLRSGSTGAAVRVLQQGLGGLVVDGKVSAKTVTAIKALQTAAKLPVTGVVDTKTWNALEKKVHPLLPHWGTVLKRGAKGSAVTALQKALRISADGSFGPKTEAAVKAAQKTAKLTQTGVVGTVTWKAIEARMPR